MATHTIPSVPAMQPGTFSSNLNLVKKFNAFADSQQEWAMAYYIGSLMLIGCLLLPVTFLIVYALGGPVATFLGISMLSFFASVIANMSGMGIRVCLSTFIFSVVIHIGMMLTTAFTYFI